MPSHFTSWPMQITKLLLWICYSGVATLVFSMWTATIVALIRYRNPYGSPNDLWQILGDMLDCGLSVCEERDASSRCIMSTALNIRRPRVKVREHSASRNAINWILRCWVSLRNSPEKCFKIIKTKREIHKAIEQRKVFDLQSPFNGDHWR